MNFTEKLTASWARSASMLCVGLDPDLKRLPPGFGNGNEGLERFCKAIVDATAASACAFKPQIAYFASAGAEQALERVIRHIQDNYPTIPVILDAKRGDIGATASHYAREAFERYGADAVTINPYMGSDSISPYGEFPDKGVFILCRTSNPGGDDLQSLPVTDSAPGEAHGALYQKVASLAAGPWNTLVNGQAGLVVGATYPDELKTVRAMTGDMPLLVPGIGAQGGDIDATVAAGLDSRGCGMLINSSRAILYASAGPDFARAAAMVAQATRDAINRARAQCGLWT
ncbi:MAG: orotidine-5'-phosphate decarboxylase [Burkholderiaceae bacterium]